MVQKIISMYALQYNDKTVILIIFNNLCISTKQGYKFWD